MAVPKKKTSQSRKRRRHGMWQRVTLKKLANKLNLVKSKDSGEYKLWHHVCLKTGMYDWKQVMNIKTKKDDVIDA